MNGTNFYAIYALERYENILQSQLVYVRMCVVGYMKAINSPVDKINGNGFPFPCKSFFTPTPAQMQTDLTISDDEDNNNSSSGSNLSVISSIRRSRFCCAPKYVISRIQTYMLYINNCYDIWYTYFNITHFICHLSCSLARSLHV